MGQNGSIINTSDGGQNWSIQSIRDEKHDFLSGTFASEREGWLVERYPGRLSYTNDGENNW